MAPTAPRSAPRDSRRHCCSGDGGGQDGGTAGQEVGAALLARTRGRAGCGWRAGSSVPGPSLTELTEGGSDGSVPFLPCRVPDLRFNNVMLHHDVDGGKLHADRGLAVGIELPAAEPAQQVGLPNTAVADQDDLQAGSGVTVVCCGFMGSARSSADVSYLHKNVVVVLMPSARRRFHLSVGMLARRRGAGRAGGIGWAAPQAPRSPLCSSLLIAASPASGEWAAQRGFCTRSAARRVAPCRFPSLGTRKLYDELRRSTGCLSQLQGCGSEFFPPPAGSPPRSPVCCA